MCQPSSLVTHLQAFRCRPLYLWFLALQPTGESIFFFPKMKNKTKKRRKRKRWKNTFHVPPNIINVFSFTKTGMTHKNSNHCLSPPFFNLHDPSNERMKIFQTRQAYNHFLTTTRENTKITFFFSFCFTKVCRVGF